mmetsp:Transcript_27278/g.69442  ORF Transcript_27278/g.69442 Transcript_27278/m.69442 type:complete len:222 (+) Transcript_27278:442-1107(+)
MAMFFFRQGENAPDVTSPICLPSGVRISECWRAGAPCEMKPTRRLVTPSASCLRMTSPPRKSNFSRLRLPTVHARPASMGEMDSSRSLPYRHSPASRRSESRGPRPHRRTALLPISFSVSATAWLLGTLISNPSSPVYPVRVHHTGMPDTSKRRKDEKVRVLRFSLVRACSTSAALGPCRASRLRSSCTSMATCLPLDFHAPRCWPICARSLSRQPALTTT